MSVPRATPGDFSEEALARLAFRRQFVIGAGADAMPAWWRRLCVDGELQAAVHPDLEACQASDGRRTITLFGYLLDPDEPGAGDQEILQRLVRDLGACEDVIPRVASLGGRWVLAVHDGERTIVLGDPGGLRQVYYATDSATAGPACASQPSLIAEARGLAPDDAAVDFVRARGEAETEVYWLPGDASPYESVRALLPNHLLDLRSGSVTRFWPSADLQPLAADTALAESVRLLRGLLASARRRRPLAISMTAGWDSRLMLALARDAADDLYCFTLTYPGVSDKARDVAVPARLLGRLGLGHHVVRYPSAVEPGFRAVSRRSSAALSNAYCADGQALYGQYPPERLCLTGDVAEIVKCHYRRPPASAGAPGPDELVSIAKITPHPFATAAVARWLATAAPRNVELLDLFCWEQMAGRWQAQIRSEFDLVHESFAPLNCRLLLETMLCVEEAERRGPEFRFLRRLIEALWADVLCEPINPKERVGVLERAAKMLARARLYRLVPRPAIRLAKRLAGR